MLENITGLLIFFVGFIFAPTILGWSVSYPKGAVPGVALVLILVCITVSLCGGAVIRYYFGD